jgi:hypothetical protein
MFGGMAFGRPGGFALNSSAWGVRPQPKVTQGPLNSGLLGTPTPASVAGVNPVPENVMAVEDVPMPTFEDPMAMYTTLKPLPSQVDDPYGYAWRPPKNFFSSTAPKPWPGQGVTPQGFAPSGQWPGQGVSPISRDPNELSNHNWSGDRVGLRGVAGGQGIKAWDTRGAARPSGRGFGGWNSLGFN